MAPLNRRPRPGIAIRQSASLRLRDCAAIERIPLTAPARALLDFAAGGDPVELERALNELRIARLLPAAELAELRQRSRGHHGWKGLGALLDAELEPGFSRAEGERRLLGLLRSASLPEPQRNARIGRWEVDMLWPELRLVVEIDGYDVHSQPRAFERDRVKQAELQELGYEVLRFSWLQIARRHLWVIGRLAAAIGRRRTATG